MRKLYQENGVQGDFILWCGYVETCATTHLDTEFVMRSVRVNKLTPYLIDNHCSYYHINHARRRKNRDLNESFVQIKNFTFLHI